MRSSRWFCLLLLALSVPAPAQIAVEEFRKQWPDFRYLEPSQARELPPAVRADLEKLGCRIPKFVKWDARHNIIHGQFLRAGQQDWAVLCRVGDKTGILIYPGGVVTELPMLRAQPNDPARTIHAISAFVLQKRAVRDHPDEPPPAFEHDAIEDGPIQKPGRLIYYSEEEWTEF